MVGLLAICGALWLARNKYSFEGKLTRSPTEIICSASSFISYWAGLQKGGDEKMLEDGASILKQAAPHFHPRSEGKGQVLLQC